jgi:hypothetical protein
MKTQRCSKQRLTRRLCAVALAAALAGCGQRPLEEGAWDGAGLQELRHEPLAHAPTVNIKDQEVLEMVLDSTLPDTHLTTRAWVEQESRTARGQIMFPNWTVTRRGHNRYEVRYVYTVIDEENRMGRKGYSWLVDVALRNVGPPREFTPADPHYKPRDLGDKQRKRAMTEEFSLE